MGIVPALVSRDRVVGSISLAILVGALWLSGWWILRAGWARDPNGAILGALVTGRAGPLALSAVLALGLLLAFQASAGAAGIFWLAVGWSLLLAWSRSADRDQLGDRIAAGFLLGGSVLFSLGIAELAFRLPVVTDRTGGNRPGGARWEATQYDRLWRRNLLGIRSLHTGPKPQGVVRIVALGDSFTWGYYVAKTEDTWPYVLERRLTSEGKRVEVINLGRNGASTKEEATLLTELGWLFNPDFVLVQYTLNDPITGPYRAYFRTYALVPWVNDYLTRHSYFFSFLHAQWEAVQWRFRYPDGENGLYRDDFTGWLEARAALQGIADSARSRGVPVMLVVFPQFAPGRLDSAGYRFHLAHDSVRAAGAAAGLEVLDLAPVFWRLGRDGPSWWSVPHDQHPGIEGHRLAGETVARLLGPRIGAGSEYGVDEERRP